MLFARTLLISIGSTCELEIIKSSSFREEAKFVKLFPPVSEIIFEGPPKPRVRLSGDFVN